MCEVIFGLGAYRLDVAKRDGDVGVDTSQRSGSDMAAKGTASVSAGDGLPPGLSQHDRVVLFDGVCRLCSAWARFLIRFDRHHVFRLATVQSRAGQRILAWHGLPTDSYETMVLADGASIYTKSTAFLRIVARLPWPWPILAMGWVIPRVIRDWLYDRIARNRYTLFGRYDTCMVPSADVASRFLDEPDG